MLGFFCHHQYAHSHESGRFFIPAAFKGVDLAVYSVFRALGLDVGVHPIVQNKLENLGGMYVKRLSQEPPPGSKGDHVKGFLERLKANEDRPDRYGYESDEEAYQEDWIDHSSVEVFGSRPGDCDEGK